MKTKIAIVCACVVCSIIGYIHIKAIEKQQTAIINTLGTAGIIERDAQGAILVHKVIRYKDLPPQE